MALISFIRSSVVLWMIIFKLFTLIQTFKCKSSRADPLKHILIHVVFAFFDKSQCFKHVSNVIQPSTLYSTWWWCLDNDLLLLIWICLVLHHLHQICNLPQLQERVQARYIGKALQRVRSRLPEIYNFLFLVTEGFIV